MSGHLEDLPPDLTVRRVFKRYWRAFYRKTFTTELRCGCVYDHRKKKPIAWKISCLFEDLETRRP